MTKFRIHVAGVRSLPVESVSLSVLIRQDYVYRQNGVEQGLNIAVSSPFPGAQFLVSLDTHPQVQANQGNYRPDKRLSNQRNSYRLAGSYLPVHNFFHSHLFVFIFYRTMVCKSVLG